MNTYRNKQSVVTTLLAGLVALICGCRPSVKKVTGVVSTIPLGASRDQVRQILLDAYSDRLPKSWKSSYDLNGPPLPVTSQMIEAHRRVIAGHRRRGEFVSIYPPDLYEKGLMAFTDTIGLAAESAYGNGAISLYYDARTNHVGYLAFSTAKDQR